MYSILILIKHLVGGFKPFETYLSNWIISPGRDEHIPPNGKFEYPLQMEL